MDNSDLLKDIKELEKQIEILPKGYISKKTIKGNVYYYYRYKVQNKIIEKYIDKTELFELQEKIELRKSLTKQLKILKNTFQRDKNINKNEFKTNVFIGEDLKEFVDVVKTYRKRECFDKIQDYIYSDIYNKVLILCGLRRTGKTTLIRQTLLNMKKTDFNNAAFIQVRTNDTMAELNQDLKLLKSKGYKYIFIDEVTLLADFIEGAALFSDIYAASKIKVILSGTDSLGFMITKSEELYDRCILVHTTLIPYREFERVLGICGIDEYIRYGGTMTLGGDNYNPTSIFADKKTTNEYVNTAIAKNIQHSLKYYQDGGHFRHLGELYEKQELTSVINRVVEDINHKFTKEVLTKEFQSSDLGISARNLRKDENCSTEILDKIDKNSFTYRLKGMLDILNKNEQSVKIEEIHALEIKEYLAMLDLIYEVEVRSFPNINNIEKITVVSQPGLRYAQATSLLDSLLLDELFNTLSLSEVNYITNRILNEIKGRMMEDIVLLETKLSKPTKKVFKLKFNVGEFDMVVFDPNTSSCDIYEIKYSKEIVSNQYKHLIDEEKCNQTEFKFGPIKNKIVIYRGNTQQVGDINYINVEKYLNSL